MSARVRRRGRLIATRAPAKVPEKTTEAPPLASSGPSVSSLAATSTRTRAYSSPRTERDAAAAGDASMTRE